MYTIGYRGVLKLEDADGTHDELLTQPEKTDASEQTETLPWEVDMDKTIITRDEEEENYSFTCNIVRDFKTVKSGIPLSGGEKLELTAGYKVYQSPTYKFPLYKDHTTGLVWTAHENEKGAFDSLLAGSMAFTTCALIALLSF